MDHYLHYLGVVHEKHQERLAEAAAESKIRVALAARQEKHTWASWFTQLWRAFGRKLFKPSTPITTKQPHEASVACYSRGQYSGAAACPVVTHRMPVRTLDPAAMRDVLAKYPATRKKAVPYR